MNSGDAETSQPSTSSPASSVRHPRAFWFFFWGEFAERSSFYGMRAILPLYLTTVLHFSDATGGTIYYWFKMGAYFLPLVGGFLADRFFGKFWTIVGFSLPYVLGHFILGIPNIPCLIVALVLLAGGSGVIKPNISSLMGQTYDQQRPGQTALRTAAFLWFYFAINIGALISQLVLPTLRNNYGYALAFQFPAWLMVGSLLIFALGKRHYAVETFERRQLTPEERRQRRATFYRLFKLFGLIVFFWVAYEQNDSLWVFFARDYVDLQVPWTSFHVAPDQLQFINALFVLILIPLFRWLFNKFDPSARILTPMKKMLLGFAATTIAAGIICAAGYLANRSAITDAGLEELKNLRDLTELDVSHIELSDASIEEFKRELPKVRMLLKTSYARRGQGMSDMKQAFWFQPDETWNSIPHETITDAMLHQLADHPDLKFIDLSGSKVTDAGLKELAQLPNLRGVDLSNTQLTDAGLAELAKVPNLSSLRLAGDKITAAGLQQIGQLPHLFVLDLSSTQTTDEGVSQLAPLTELATLDLSGTLVTDAGVKTVSQLPKLMELNLSFTRSQVSLWWLVIAYIVLTVGEVLVYGTGLELAYVLAPANMKGFVTACFLLTNTLGNFVNSWLSQLYGGSLTDLPAKRGPLAPGAFFGLTTLIVGSATVAFYFVGRQFDRRSAADAQAATSDSSPPS